jgi:proline-specific peptidase
MSFSDQGFVAHRGHRVWYGVSGRAAGETPLLTVHGGPGLGHDYLEPLIGLARRRKVVFYDQYGCGGSDRAANPLEYDIDLFVEEIDAVRDAVGLDEVHLYAHSYGGPLVLQYLLSGPRRGVRSLTLSNSFASVPALVEGWAERRAALSPEAQQALTAAEKTPQAQGSESYGAALTEFVNRFVLAFPHPQALDRSQQRSFGAEVYSRMHGSSWFQPDGLWQDFDVTSRLHELQLPTLLIAGSNDQCVPALSEAMRAEIPTSRLVVLDTAHLPFFERPAEYLAAIDGFLSGIVQ